MVRTSTRRVVLVAPEDQPAIPQRRLRPTWRLEIDEEEQGAKAEIFHGKIGPKNGVKFYGKYMVIYGKYGYLWQKSMVNMVIYGK